MAELHVLALWPVHPTAVHCTLLIRCRCAHFLPCLQIVGTAVNTTVTATLYMVPKANCTCLDILSQLNQTGLLNTNVCNLAGPQCSALGISSLIFTPVTKGVQALQKLLLTRAFRTAFKASKLLTKFA